MDKIKTVKIKNLDGSISEESYTITTDAQYVDMENGKNVQETMDDLNQEINILKETDININKNLDILNVDIKKKAYFFNTVADIKNAELKNGDYICTLGYYEVNDGGAAEYQIVSGNYIDNAGSYYKLNNNLFAKLIVTNEINIKQFGAYGDGTHDDSDFLQNAIDFLTEYKKELVLYPGTYKITKTININENTCFKPINRVIFRSTYNGPLLKITKAVEHKNFNIINGNGQLRLVSTQGINSNAIGIEIGDESATTSLSDINFNNVVINNFNIGVKILNRNNWNITFNACDFFFNQYGLYYGGTTHLNSGERISVTNSVFTQNKVDVYVSSTLWSQMNFYNCSFDFSDCMFWVDWSSPNYSANNNKISLSQCHIEGIGHNVQGVPENTPFGILYGYGMYSLVFSLTDSCIVLNKNYYWFNILTDTKRNGYVFLDNVFVINDYLNNKFYPTLAINCRVKTNNLVWRMLPNAVWAGQSSTRQVVIPSSVDNTLNSDPLLTTLTEGSYETTANTEIGSHWTLVSPTGLLNINCVSEQLYNQNNKYLDFTFNTNYSGAYTVSCGLKSDKIKVSPNTLIAPVVYTNNSGITGAVNKTLSYSIKFYDRDDNQIGESYSYIPAAPGMINDNIVSLLPSVATYVPANTDYMQATITLRNGVAGDVTEHRIVRGIFFVNLM